MQDSSCKPQPLKIKALFPFQTVGNANPVTMHHILNKNHGGSLKPFMTQSDKLRWDHVAGNSAYPTHPLMSQTTLRSVKVMPFIQWGWLLQRFMEWDSPSIISCIACFQDVFVFYCKQPYVFFVTYLLPIIQSSVNRHFTPKMGSKFSWFRCSRLF